MMRQQLSLGDILAARETRAVEWVKRWLPEGEAPDYAAVARFCKVDEARLRALVAGETPGFAGRVDVRGTVGGPADAEAQRRPVAETVPAAPMPAALARIVPDNLELKAQKQFAAMRWTQLNAKRLDAMRPVADRAFEFTTADQAELRQLDTYMAWFS